MLKSHNNAFYRRITWLATKTTYIWHFKRKTEVQQSCKGGREDKTLSGRVVDDAKRVMGMELVLEARIADGFAILSNSRNSFLLTSSDSTIASMMTSAE